MFKPRPMQAEVLRYRQGKMGVSAVPGSGKTHTLSYLAARLIAEEYVGEDQEVLIVTLVNSAVDNFSHRVEIFLKEYGILPGMNYRVRTLHGLAHDIVRERPDLVGLSNQFQIIADRDATEILQDASTAWLRSHPEMIDALINPELDANRSREVQKNWPELVISIAQSFIRQAKDLQATPFDIHQKLEGLSGDFPLLHMGAEIYSDYQRALNYRGAVDFDDLIRLALQALQTDPEYLNRLRYRWAYILEDEAQDSSRLQEELLQLLAGEDGNWVRVGDPNQAIYETFTTASPKFLLNFLRRPDVDAKTLPNSGRSTPSIIRLANFLIRWTQQSHPNEALRQALTPPYIQPVPADDPQPNPPDQPDGIFISDRRFPPDEEIQQVVRSLQKWLPDHPEATVAALVPRNERGAKLVEQLKQHGLPYVELLRSSYATRQTAGTLTRILRYLVDPASPVKLASVYMELRREQSEQAEPGKIIHAAAAALRKCPRLEDYLQPGPERDWLAELAADGAEPEVLQELEWFRPLIVRWQNATLLPIDQLILTIAQEWFTHPADLALAHKIALVMERLAENHPEWRLKQFAEELNSVAENRRTFMGLSEDDTGFDPDQHRGKVVVATIHKAKGLEWDRVYLLSVNNYDFPSADPQDSFISERWFVRDRLNLQAELLASLKALLAGDTTGLYLEEGLATRAARLEYAEERLRLLYVGITRARKELVITWNSGQRNDCQMARPLQAMIEFLEGNADDAAS